MRRTVRSVVDEKLDDLLSFWAHLWIIGDEKSMSCTIKTLPRPQKFIKLTETKTGKSKKVRLRPNASFSLEGKPLFIVVAGRDCSLSTKFCKDREVEAGYSASEIHDRTHCRYFRKIFRAIKLDKTYFTILFLSIICSVMLTFIFTSMYLKSTI